MSKSDDDDRQPDGDQQQSLEFEVVDGVEVEVSQMEDDDDDDDGQSSQEHQHHRYVVNPQEMIIANDVEAEAEDDDEDCEDADDEEEDEDDMDNDGQMIGGSNMVVVDFSSNGQQKQEQRNGHESDSDSDGSGSSSESGSSSGSGSGSSDSEESGSDEDDESVQDGPPGQPLNVQVDEEEEEEDEDEELDIDEVRKVELSSKPETNTTSTSGAQILKIKQEQQLNNEELQQQRPSRKPSTEIKIEDNVQKSSNHSIEKSKQEQDDNNNPKQESRNSQFNKYKDEAEVLKNCDEHGVYKWKDFEGVKIKAFPAEEYERYQVPFMYGWKRELVLRCTGSTAEKKAGDVYYHLPDGSLKLRSYVEMNQFLKRNSHITELDITNFTFAKQPVYRPPDEIVRHAMQRGANFVERPFCFNQNIKQKYNHLPRPQSQSQTNFQNYQQQQTPNAQQQQRHRSSQSLLNNSVHQQQQSLLSTNEDSNDVQDLSTGGILGRGKRKRVLPSRYDDNEIDLNIPVLNKKSKTGGSANTSGSSGVRESFSNSNSNDGHSPQSNKSTSVSIPTAKLTQQERRRFLQHQLYQKVNEGLLEEERLAAKAAAASGQQKDQQQKSNSSLKMKIIKQQNGNHRRVDHNNTQQQNRSDNLMNSSLQPDSNMVVDDNSMAAADDSQTNGHGGGQQEEQSSTNVRQPCSNHCPGRRNMVPNLMCYRCFCLFHLECVPDGMFVDRKFYCPNCLKQENIVQTEVDDDSTSLNLTKNNNDSAKSNNKHRSSSSSSHNHYNRGHHRSSTASIASNIQSMLISAVGNDHLSNDPNSLLLKHQQSNNKSANSLMMQQQKFRIQQSPMAEHSSINGGGTNSMRNAFKWQKKQQQILQQMQQDHQGSTMIHIQNGNCHPSAKSNAGSSLMMAAQQYNRNIPNGYYHKHSLSRKIVPPLPPNHQKVISTSRSSSPQNGHSSGNQLNFQPGINHVYRLAQAANGHAVVIKDRTQPLTNGSGRNSPLLSNTNSGINEMTNGTMNSSTTSLNYLKQATKLFNMKQSLLNAAAQQIARSQYYLTLTESGNRTEFGVRSLGHSPINYQSKWWKYQQKSNNIMHRFDLMMVILMKLVDYLDWKDIQSIRLVNKQWYQMLSTPKVWQHLRLRGSTVSDWKYFATNILLVKSVRTIDFTGIRVPLQQHSSDSNRLPIVTRNEKICNFWKLFQTNVMGNLNEISSLRFGTIPIFLLKELFDTKKNEKLRHLAVLNLFDEACPNDPCPLEFMTSLNRFKDIKLESLQLDSKNGFILPDDDDETMNIRQEQLRLMLNSLKQLSSVNMNSFHCTSLKNFSTSEFAQLLEQFDIMKIKHLSIGSCSNWFVQTEKETISGREKLFEKLAQFGNLLSLKLNDLNITNAASPFVNLFESLIIIERLILENLTIHKSAKLMWTSFVAILKSLPLVEFRVSSSDPFTNRCLFEALIQLLATQKRSIKVYWSVTVNIDDVGCCFIPLSLESFSLDSNQDSDGHLFAEQFCSKLDRSNQDAAISNNFTSLFQVVPSTIDQGDNKTNKQMILMEMDTVHEIILKKVKLRHQIRQGKGGSDPKFVGPSFSLHIIPQ